MGGHGITHTNVLPRLGIGADFAGQGLHSTLVMNGVLTDWARGKVRALAAAPPPFPPHSLKQDYNPLR